MQHADPCRVRQHDAAQRPVIELARERPPVEQGAAAVEPAPAARERGMVQEVVIVGDGLAEGTAERGQERWHGHEQANPRPAVGPEAGRGVRGRGRDRRRRGGVHRRRRARDLGVGFGWGQGSLPTTVLLDSLRGTTRDSSSRRRLAEACATAAPPPSTPRPAPLRPERTRAPPAPFPRAARAPGASPDRPRTARAACRPPGR